MEENSTSPSEETPESRYGIKIIDRTGWMANSVNQGKPLEKVSFVVYGHTRNYTERLKRNVHDFHLTDEASGKEKVKAIQDFDSRFEGDIKYSFLIGTEGTVFEGRGWHISPALPKKYHKIENQCLFLAFLEPLPGAEELKAMIETRTNLIKYGVSQGFVNSTCTEITTNNMVFWPLFKKFISRR